MLVQSYAPALPVPPLSASGQNRLNTASSVDNSSPRKTAAVQFGSLIIGGYLAAGGAITYFLLKGAKSMISERIAEKERMMDAANDKLLKQVEDSVRSEFDSKSSEGMNEGEKYFFLLDLLKRPANSMKDMYSKMAAVPLLTEIENATQKIELLLLIIDTEGTVEGYPWPAKEMVGATLLEPEGLKAFLESIKEDEVIHPPLYGLLENLLTQFKLSLQDPAFEPSLQKAKEALKESVKQI